MFINKRENELAFLKMQLDVKIAEKNKKNKAILEMEQEEEYNKDNELFETENA